MALDRRKEGTDEPVISRLMTRSGSTTGGAHHLLRRGRLVSGLDVGNLVEFIEQLNLHEFERILGSLRLRFGLGLLGRLSCLCRTLCVDENGLFFAATQESNFIVHCHFSLPKHGPIWSFACGQATTKRVVTNRDSRGCYPFIVPHEVA